MSVKYFAAIVVTILFLFRGRVVMGNLISNAGMLAVHQILESDSTFRIGAENRNLRYELLNGSAPLISSRLLKAAVKINENTWQHRWRLGRTSLATGNTDLAANTFSSILVHAEANRLLYQEAIHAFYLTKNFELIVELDKVAAPPSFPDSNYARKDLYMSTKEIRDMIVRSYHEIGSIESMQRVVELRPGDIKANYLLLQHANRTSMEQEAGAYRTTLERTPSFFAAPLIDQDISVVPDLLVDGIWDRKRVREAVAFVTWHHDSSSLLTALQRLHVLYPHDPFWTYYLGDFHRLRGNMNSAKEYYEQTLVIDPTYRDSYLRLSMIAASMCEHSQLDSTCALHFNRVKNWYDQYQALFPDDPVGLQKLAEIQLSIRNMLTIFEDAETKWLRDEWKQDLLVRGPQVELNQTLSDRDWTFVGYSGDVEALIRGEETTMWFYWLLPQGATAGTKEDGWYYLGESTWVQIVHNVKNLVINGGFELGVVEGFPAGFPYDQYDCQEQLPRLVTVDHDDNDSVSVLLDNERSCQRQSLVSSAIPVIPNTLYLQVGWVLSKNGNGFVGRNWLGEIPAGVRSYSYSRVSRDSNPSGWQLHAAITEPLFDVQHVELWLLNYESAGQVYFDNIMFVKIDRPHGLP